MYFLLLGAFIFYKHILFTFRNWKLRSVVWEFSAWRILISRKVRVFDEIIRIELWSDKLLQTRKLQQQQSNDWSRTKLKTVFMSAALCRGANSDQFVCVSVSASGWKSHFWSHIWVVVIVNYKSYHRLHLCSFSTEFAETWQEARTQRPPPWIWPKWTNLRENLVYLQIICLIWWNPGRSTEKEAEFVTSHLLLRS